MVSELTLPPGLILAVIQRKGETIVPRGDIALCQGDSVVLAAEGSSGEIGITLKEFILKERHPWVGHEIKDLDISRQTLIVMVRRDGKALIPNGSTVLLENDAVFVYSKRNIADAQKITI